MALFGILELESIVQTNDKTRLNASKSFVSKDEAAITLVEIEADTALGFIDVFASNPKDWFLDWQYATNGTKTVSVRITSGTGVGAIVQTFSKDIEILDPTEDLLFSNDDDLVKYEPDIMKWVPAGRSSYLREHRTAQELILEWLDSTRVWRSDGTKLKKEDLSLTDDLKKLSTFKALELIFFGISNKTDDVFLIKSRAYAGKAAMVQNRGRIQADFNGNGTLESNESMDLRSYRIIRA